MAIATRAVTELTRGRADFARTLNGRVTVVFPRFSDLAARITIEREMGNEAGWVQKTFAAAGVAVDPLVVGIEPSGAEIEEATVRTAAADASVLFLYDAMLYPSNRALLDAVQKSARRLAVVVMRNPYDAALLAPGVVGITAYGWRRCQLEAVVARLAFP
jgi:hypothetical protein